MTGAFLRSGAGSWWEVGARGLAGVRRQLTVHCIGALRRAGPASTDLSWSMAQRRNYSAIIDLDTNVPATGMRANHEEIILLNETNGILSADNRHHAWRRRRYR